MSARGNCSADTGASGTLLRGLHPPRDPITPRIVGRRGDPDDAAPARALATEGDACMESGLHQRVHRARRTSLDFAYALHGADDDESDDEADAHKGMTSGTIPPLPAASHHPPTTR